MVRKEKVVTGVCNYIENEILRGMPYNKALLLGGLTTLCASRANTIINNIAANPAVKMLGIIDGDQIDIDAVYQAFTPRFTQPMEFDIPLVGRLSLDRQEADRLMDYIRSA